MNKFLLLTFLLAVAACRPAQESTDYVVSIAPQSSPDATYTTNMNVAVEIDYHIEQDEDSVDLKLVITKQPIHGQLIDCEKSTDLRLNCMYEPNTDFIGVDYVHVKSIDGDIQSNKDAVISINVIDNSVHPPVVGADQSFITEQGETKSFEVNKASDPDTKHEKLQYYIENSVKHGQLSDCFASLGNISCKYTPNANYIGSDSFTYRVKDNADNKSLKSAKVSFTIKPKIYTGSETFQSTQNKTISSVDITWIIDNSGSMQNDQDRLKDSFQSFIQNFVEDTAEGKKAKYPFKMGVTTTDAYINSRKVMREDPSTGEMYVLTSSAAENDYTKFVSDFKDAVGVGTYGDGEEKALLSASEITKKYSSWYGGNDTLSIYVIVSDEMEQSLTQEKDNRGDPLLDANGNPYTIERWAYEFASLKDNASKTRFFPIILPSNDHGNAKYDNGKHYQKLAEMTNGKVYDITKPFDDVLDGISNAITELFDSYLLDGSRVIDSSTIQVYVNDNLVTNWTYANYAIKFNEPVADGATIKVTYQYYNRATQ